MAEERGEGYVRLLTDDRGWCGRGEEEEEEELEQEGEKGGGVRGR